MSTPRLILLGRARTLCAMSLSARYSSMAHYLWAIDLALPQVARRDEVLAGIAEALGNAIVHGALGISSQARDEGDIEAFLSDLEQAEQRFGGARRVSVVIRARGRGVEVVIRDGGPGFDWHGPAADGHGIAILRTIFDDVRWSPQGNTVHLTLHGGFS